MAELHELNGSSLPGTASVFEPIMAHAAIPSATPFIGANPELVELVREARASGARVAAASSRRDAILRTATARPAPPEALFKRMADNTWTSLSLAQAFRNPNLDAEIGLPRRLWFGEPTTIETLRQHGDQIADGPVGQMEDGTIVPLSRPNEAARARIAEILAAYDAWQAAINAWKVTSGYAAACEEWDAAIEARLALWPKLAEAPARTLADFALKASAAFDTAEEVDDVAKDHHEGLSGYDLVGAMMTCDAARIYFAGDLAGTAHLPAAELDAPIVEAWQRHQDVAGRREAAWIKAEDLLGAYVARGSKLAELFRPREDDFASNPDLARTLEADAGGFYTSRSVNLLRRVAITASPHAARAAEIVDAYDGYSRPMPELDAANAAHEAIGKELTAIGEVVRDTPALSLEGIRLKASWALARPRKDEEDPLAVLQQVEDFAQRHAKPTKVADALRLERDAMVHDVERSAEFQTPAHSIIESVAAEDFEPWPADVSLPLDRQQWSEEFGTDGPHARSHRLAYALCIKTKADLVETVRAIDADNPDMVKKLYDILQHTTEFLDCLRNYTDTASARLLAAAAIVSLEQEAVKERAA